MSTIHGILLVLALSSLWLLGHTPPRMAMNMSQKVGCIWSKTTTWVACFRDSGGTMVEVTLFHLDVLNVWKWPGKSVSEGSMWACCCGQGLRHFFSVPQPWASSAVVVHAIPDQDENYQHHCATSTRCWLRGAPVVQCLGAITGNHSHIRFWDKTNFLCYSKRQETSQVQFLAPCFSF